MGAAASQPRASLRCADSGAHEKWKGGWLPRPDQVMITMLVLAVGTALSVRIARLYGVRYAAVNLGWVLFVPLIATVLLRARPGAHVDKAAAVTWSLCAALPGAVFMFLAVGWPLEGP